MLLYKGQLHHHPLEVNLSDIAK